MARYAAALFNNSTSGTTRFRIPALNVDNAAGDTFVPIYTVPAGKRLVLKCVYPFRAGKFENAGAVADHSSTTKTVVLPAGTGLLYSSATSTTAFIASGFLEDEDPAP